MKRKIRNILIIITFTLAVFSSKSYGETIKTMKIVLDPGHGGHESGAVNNDAGIIEKDINLCTTRYLKEYLEKYYGLTILMTHNGLDNNTEMSIVDRSMFARNNNADLLLCLHYNSSEDSSWHGSEVYVTTNKSCYKYNQETSIVGNLILNNLSKLGLTNRGVKTRLCNDTGEKWQYYDGSRADYYGIIRYALKGDAEDKGIDFSNGSGLPTILIEHAYIIGNDIEYINSDAKLKKIAEADGKAIVNHYNLKLKSEVPSEIAFDKEITAMNVEDKDKIVATISPDTASNKNIIWTSSNENIVKVDSEGNIEAIAEGKATIRAMADGNDAVSKSIEINITKPILNIENGMETNAILGSKTQLITDQGSNQEKIIWKSLDESIATVDENGLVTTKSEGTCKIEASIPSLNLSSSIKINVIKLADEESIKMENIKESAGIISNFSRGMTLKEFNKNIILTGGLTIDSTLNSDELIGTNTKIKIKNSEGTVVQDYVCKLYGDINGDGRISAIDYVLIKNKILGIKDITGDIKREVSDINGDGKISAIDYVLIKNDILGVKKIETK